MNTLIHVGIFLLLVPLVLAGVYFAINSSSNSRSKHSPKWGVVVVVCILVFAAGYFIYQNPPTGPIQNPPTGPIQDAPRQSTPARGDEGLQYLTVKAGEKAYLHLPFGASSVTWDLKEWGPSVTVTYEVGNMVVLLPDGKGGTKESKSFTYTKGGTVPERKGKMETVSFLSEQDVTIQYRVNYRPAQ